MVEMKIRLAVGGDLESAFGIWEVCIHFSSIASVIGMLSEALPLGETKEKAYQHFITSLKRSPSFAPAFTSLGIYYAEFTSPPDPNRASKCFQKAFELDAREVDSARRLAEGFAEEREWDLVEVIAKRAIEGEGGVPDGAGADQQAATSSKFLPVNAWAWKAVGVVELVRCAPIR
jgi:superkiller protein 3